ncbi:head-tail adaptor protein [Ancylobacter dichloromethanicus]|uniref:Tail protein n=1 Tax=Ancylobacter dichloromethanicus TaxID=518825 RepID=A0A9W6J3A6_9HYPH|nr:head-tail adaptor protein [Ancylobacter dichloromethanicus]MBS7556148.1 head-tail adaptor protein [Ancylobacter dichloromethanicus]GLK69902.1 tail protein [Ancylobacter dichloromethanicus]
MSAIGALRHRLVQETPVTTPDGLGGASVSFIAVDALWGAVETRGTPAEIADRPGALLAHTVTVRAPATVQPGDRLRCGARRFLVEAVSDPDGRGRYLVCDCREETP